MKKLFALLFAGALAISLAMPVFAQDQGGQSSQGGMSSDQGASSSTTKKPAKAKKAKKAKKSKSTDTGGAAAPQQ